MAQPVIVDLRNIYLPEDMAARGFSYESIGRAPQKRN
jgi:UDPglucose 6-dehydrogenase